MTQTTKGVVYIILSAILYGLMPVLVKLITEGGSNALNTNFQRALIGLPVMYVVLRLRGVPAIFTAGQWKNLFLTFGIGAVATTSLLYLSYTYIPVGVATSLHFIYPASVTLAYVLFYNARPKALTWLALAACLAGVFILGGKPGSNGASWTGAALALGSGLTFTCYFVGLDKTELKFMPFYKLIFALCLITVICGGALGFVTKQLTFALTAKAWGYMLILALTSTLVATGLLQRGIQLTDGATAAILSTFEPTTSFFFAAAILGEEVNAIHILGCGLIVLSVVVLARSKAGRER